MDEPGITYDAPESQSVVEKGTKLFQHEMQIPSSFLTSGPAEADFEHREVQEALDIQHLMKYLKQQHSKYLKPIIESQQY